MTDVSESTEAFVAEFLEGWLERYPSRESASSRAPLVGVSGAQGCGKTTLVEALCARLGQKVRPLALSLDDFYLSKVERSRLARRVHPLLATRGVPTTHDVALLAEVIDALQQGAGALVPRFDKAVDDRANPSSWTRVPAGSVDVILLEGWCVGIPPEASSKLAVPANDLERERDADETWRRAVNHALATTYRDLFRRLDLLVALLAPSFDVVFAWRQQQERALAATEPDGRAPLLDPEELRRFISHFERLTCHALNVLPDVADLLIYLDEQRRPLRMVPAR